MERYDLFVAGHHLLMLRDTFVPCHTMSYHAGSSYGDLRHSLLVVINATGCRSFHQCYRRHVVCERHHYHTVDYVTVSSWSVFAAVVVVIITREELYCEDERESARRYNIGADDGTTR